METKDLLMNLKTKSDGVDFLVEYVGELPLNASAKKAGITAYKTTQMKAKKGLKYSELKSVKDRVNEGFELSHTLPWGFWKEGYEGLLIEHKGNDYVRLYPTDGTLKTTYFINNKEMTYDELKECGYLVNSFFNKKESPLEVLTIKVGNITKVE